jgi:hypothetical protein
MFNQTAPIEPIDIHHISIRAPRAILISQAVEYHAIISIDKYILELEVALSINWKHYIKLFLAAICDIRIVLN